MIHKKQIIAVLALLSLTSSVFANTPETPASSSTGSTAPTMAATSVPSTPSESLNVSGAPSVVSQTATSVTLTWSKVDIAKSYVVKYSKIDVAEASKNGDTTATYDNESDQVTTTGATISDLKTDTTYYFSVVALDAANNESPTYSEQLAVKLVADLAAASGSGAVAAVAATGSVETTAPAVASATGSLKLAGVTVINEKTLSLEFSAELSSQPVSVKLTKTSDNSTVVVDSVVKSLETPTMANVTLAAPLSTSSSYSIVIIDAADAKGLPISEGVNAVKEFVTAATLAKAPDVTTSGTELPVLNAAGQEATASGAAVTPVTAASELPPTGTKTNLLILMAAFLALGIVYFIQKKRA
jgi:hypothetical protein